jgi:hypothetical protein
MEAGALRVALRACVVWWLLAQSKCGPLWSALAPHMPSDAASSLAPASYVALVRWLLLILYAQSSKLSGSVARC